MLTIIYLANTAKLRWVGSYRSRDRCPALSRPDCHDEAKAFARLESIVWAGGQSCAHCGAMGRFTNITANPAKRIREGLWRCGYCKGQFTAKIGTVFEHARLPLHKMLQAI